MAQPFKNTWKHHPGIKICGFQYFSIAQEGNTLKAKCYKFRLIYVDIICHHNFCCFFISKINFTTTLKIANSSYEEETDFLRIYQSLLQFFKPGFSVPVCCTTCPFGIFPHVAPRAKEVSFLSFILATYLLRKQYTQTKC